MKIKTAGEALDLSSGFSIEVEDTNPIWNEYGSQSVPATVPTTPRNCLLLDFPERIDAGRHPNNPEREACVVDGAYIRSGKMNITDASMDEGITFNIGFDNSTVYIDWEKKPLNKLPNLPTYFPTAYLTPDLPRLIREMRRIYLSSRSDRDPFAVFPICVNNPKSGSTDSEDTYPELFNVPAKNTMDQKTTINRVIDGVVTEVKVPEGYCLSPFLRVWRVLEVAFSSLGMSIDGNPFKEDKELSRLVVLNNCADACCLGYVKYSDILPDCTVGEFMRSLWVRFGLTYTINFDKRVVYLRLIKDIIKDTAVLDLLPLSTAKEKITYNSPEYIKLSAKTSIDGAAPPADRWEDFIKGLDIDRVRTGSDLKHWTKGDSDSCWSGEDGGYWEMEDPDPDYIEPDYPEPEFPEPDDWDYDLDSMNSDSVQILADVVSDGSSVTADAPEPDMIAKEYVTGDWYRLDNENNCVAIAGSGFFHWDPQPEGHNAVDLASEDECVPVAFINNINTSTGNHLADYCPMFLVEARHYHSYIKGTSKTESDGSTPLAFMQALTLKGGGTVGRLTAEGTDGKPIELSDGSTPTLALYFQFRDGLFARFWSGYDELLRFANRTVTLQARIPKEILVGMNLLWPVAFRGIRCLIDKISYSLPASGDVPVELTLRPIMTQGDYDIKKVQAIPSISLADKKLAWRFVSDTFDECATTTQVRAAIANKWKEDRNYVDGGDLGDFRFVDARCVVLDGIRRNALTWDNDPALLPPNMYGQKNSGRKYKATASYQIYEGIDHATGPGDDDNWEYGALLDGLTCEVEYEVTLEAVWVDK